MLRKKFFSLLELLVVIAIIAILAGLLLPVLSKSRARSRQTVCISQLQQLGLAFVMYQSDHQDAFPHYTNGSWNAGVEGGWVFYDAFPVPVNGNFDLSRGSLFRYVNEPRVYRCPLDNTGSNCSYGVNSDTRDLKSPQVISPATVPLLLEEGSTRETTNDGYFDLDYMPRDFVVNRHAKGNVFAFCDGHVSWERWSNLEVWKRCDFMAPINVYDE